MAPNERDNEPATSEKQPAKLSLKRYSYLLSIVVGFMVPIAGLFKILKKNIPLKPLAVSFFITAVLGCSWSNFVSAHAWWHFGDEFVTGLRVFPNLPLEEFIFNPLGGLISVLIYLMGSRIKTVTSPSVYASFLVAGTIPFAVLAFYYKQGSPNYLFSQLALFNFATSLCIVFFVAKHINLIGLALSVGVLSAVGFVWDAIGLYKGWWVYYAVSGINIGIVPIEEINFYLFAPTGAVSLYVLVCRLMKSPQYIND